MNAVIRFLSTLRGARLIVAIVVVVGLILIIGRAFASMYVEVLWQSQVGYASVFWRRVLSLWAVRFVAGLGVGILVFVNLKVASATLGGIHIRRRFANIEISEQIPKNYVALGMLLAASLLAVWFGAAIPASVGWQLLTAMNAAPWGLIDPVLFNDAGFYVFWFPLLGQAVAYALIVTFLIFTLVTAGYAATGALRWTRGRIESQEIARLHLGVILAVFFLLIGGQLWLRRYALLLDGSSPVQGIFGYTDAQARLPALQTLMIICIGAGAGLLWGVWKNRAAPVIASISAVVLGSVLIGQFYPGLIQSFRVEPNELVRETPYIEHNLEFTRIGFGLDLLERSRFEYTADEPVDWAAAGRQFEGLPMWNRGALMATYRELEARFPYYDFTDVTIDRYETESGPMAIAVSVRELDPGGIQDPNWQNQHLRERYVEGMGAVASLASSKTLEGRPEMLMSGIPPEIPAGALEVTALGLERPQVFFGNRPQPYAVVNPTPQQFLAPDSPPGIAGIDFPSGIELASGIRTALLAWQFRDANLLFASDITEGSRFIFRRGVVERVREIAPFLRFPEAPYPVILDGRIVWMLEGFTGTRYFPFSTAAEFGTRRPAVSYVRNSVKVTVDAVTGRVEFYRVAIDDPLVDAFDAAFPGLFKPIEEMPGELREHVRYPKELLNLQARVLLQYHQQTAPAFHGQQDVWDGPQELAENTNPVPYRPEYGIYALPGEEDPRFHLTTVFVPAGRQNLTAILAARTNDLGVPELTLFDVPVTDQVPGPRQVEALVEQDPVISQQFSLWRTGGSEVWTGHLHLVPVGKRLLYLEPVFLAAEADAIPELRRFVVSDGRRVVMTEDLPSAIAQLAGLEPPQIVTEMGTEDVEVPTTTAAWPQAALDLLERAEGSARVGDWQGFGDALSELRTLLESLESNDR
jgi:uncharacterized membrane protein (UPF0182 family)